MNIKYVVQLTPVKLNLKRLISYFHSTKYSYERVLAPPVGLFFIGNICVGDLQNHNFPPTQMIFSPTLMILSPAQMKTSPTDNIFANTDDILANTYENFANTDDIFTNTYQNIANTDDIFTNTDEKIALNSFAIWWWRIFHL